MLASSISTRRDSESVVDAASLDIVTSNVSAQTGRITELVLDTDVDTVTSAVATRRRPNPVSTLVIHDEDDKELPEGEHVEVFKKQLSNSQLFETKGLGHFRIILDQEVAKRTADFLTH